MDLVSALLDYDLQWGMELTRRLEGPTKKVCTRDQVVSWRYPLSSNSFGDGFEDTCAREGRHERNRRLARSHDDQSHLLCSFWNQDVS